MVYLLHRKDRLRLWDGDYRGRWNRLEWPGFCGSNHPSTVVSPSNEMFIRFKSNRDAVVASGYEIRIEEGTFKLHENEAIKVYLKLSVLGISQIIFFYFSSSLMRGYHYICWKHFVSWTSSKLSKQRGLRMGCSVSRRRKNSVGIRSIQLRTRLWMQVCYNSMPSTLNRDIDTNMKILCK